MTAYDPHDFESDSSLAYIALQILCARQKSLIPEILYIFRPEQIIQFIKIFSGETIKVPTVEEFSRDISAALAVYHVYIQGHTWEWFSVKYQYAGHEMNRIKKRTFTWAESLSEPEKQFIEQLRLQETHRKDSKIATRKLVRKYGK